jgi:16S rRNA (cytosine1402-N4)-methyltransferase
MLQEVLAWLSPHAGGVYLDGTVGEGGHSLALLEASAPDGLLLGFDRDEEALSAAKQTLQPYHHRISLVHAHHHEAEALLKQMKIPGLDGVILDLGVSSRQLDRPARGFSFQSQGPLDMRMDSWEPGTAADLVNRLPEPELARMIYEKGEERYARRIARAIVRRRQSGPILTTQDLVEVIREAVPQPYLHGRIHYATRTFQALRIAVNRELIDLEPSLRMLSGLLAPSARLAVISFHSLEDRIVKHTFRDLERETKGTFMILTKRPLTPSSEERRENPRSRSAKMRVLARQAA